MYVCAIGPGPGPESRRDGSRIETGTAAGVGSPGLGIDGPDRIPPSNSGGYPAAPGCCSRSYFARTDSLELPRPSVTRDNSMTKCARADRAHPALQCVVGSDWAWGRLLAHGELVATSEVTREYSGALRMYSTYMYPNAYVWPFCKCVFFSRTDIGADGVVTSWALGEGGMHISGAVCSGPECSGSKRTDTSRLSVRIHLPPHLDSHACVETGIFLSPLSALASEDTYLR